MRGSFENKLDGKDKAVILAIDLDSTSTQALIQLDHYINRENVLKLTGNDAEATYVTECLPAAQRRCDW